MQIHILAVCGTFMGGIALLAKALGHEVTGSDRRAYPPMSDALAAAGVTIANEGDDISALIDTADIVIIGNACSRGNRWVEYVLAADKFYTSGPAWLADQVLRGRHVIAVAGTHGKTTTSSLITWVLRESGIDAGYLIGGVSHGLSASAALGSAPYFVIEADEYDTAFFDKQPKFMHYRPRTLVLNNLEFDHADIYENLEAIKKQFHFLIRTVSPMGTIIYAEEDENLAEVMHRGVWSSLESFGEGGMWEARCASEDARVFDVFYQNERCGRVTGRLLGRHNLNNTLAVIAAANQVGVSVSEAISAVNRFPGVARRLDRYELCDGMTLFDDFAHHPTSIKLTLAAVRNKNPQSYLVAIIDPRSNTMRQGDNKDNLPQALLAADKVLLYDHNLLKWNAKDLLAGNKAVEFIQSVTSFEKRVDEIINKYQNVELVMMSNGSFDGLREKLVKNMESK